MCSRTLDGSSLFIENNPYSSAYHSNYFKSLKHFFYLSLFSSLQSGWPTCGFPIMSHMFPEFHVSLLYLEHCFIYLFFKYMCSELSFQILNKILLLREVLLVHPGKSYPSFHILFLVSFVGVWAPLCHKPYLFHNIILIFNISKAVICVSKWGSCLYLWLTNHRFYFSIYWFEWVYLYNLTQCHAHSTWLQRAESNFQFKKFE